jgi:hypothetical protein
MHARMKELLEQAGIEKRTNTEGTGWDYTCLEENLTRFVESVVRECATTGYAKTGYYESVYFMHSIAHIYGIKQVLETLKTKEVIVITPNIEWLKLQMNFDYIPDSTVFKHFSKETLEELFILSGYDVNLSGQFGKKTENQCERLILKATKIG